MCNLKCEFCKQSLRSVDVVHYGCVHKECDVEIAQLRERNVELDSQLEEMGKYNYELIHQIAEFRERNKLLEAVARDVIVLLSYGPFVMSIEPLSILQSLADRIKALGALDKSEVNDDERRYCRLGIRDGSIDGSDCGIGGCVDSV